MTYVDERKIVWRLRSAAFLTAFAVLALFWGAVTMEIYARL